MNRNTGSIQTALIAVIAVIAVITVVASGAALVAKDHGAHAQNIVEIAASNDSFETLVTALQAADLVATLEGDGPFTVFAPTDEAFDKLPAGTLDSLLQDKEKLTAVLTYHVVPGKLMAADVVKTRSAKTVQGDSLAIDTSAGVKVGSAQVVQTDIEATNGVIHVIDTVLVP